MVSFGGKWGHLLFLFEKSINIKKSKKLRIMLYFLTLFDFKNKIQTKNPNKGGTF